MVALFPSFAGDARPNTVLETVDHQNSMVPSLPDLPICTHPNLMAIVTIRFKMRHTLRDLVGIGLRAPAWSAQPLSASREKIALDDLHPMTFGGDDATIDVDMVHSTGGCMTFFLALATGS